MPSLAAQILDSIPENVTVDRGSLVLQADYDTVGRALKQLVASRELVRVRRGRYRKPDGQAACRAQDVRPAAGQNAMTFGAP